MIHLNDTQVDQTESKPTRLQKLWQMVSNYKPMIGLCAGLFVLGTVAVIIIMSLIPTFLQPKNLTVYYPDPVSYVLTYATDVSNVSSLSVASTTELANSLIDGVGIPKITVNSAQLIQSSEKKRRALEDSNTQCETNSGKLNGYILRILSTIEFPSGYGSAYRQQKYMTIIEKHFKILYPTLSVSMTLTDGETVYPKLSLCSLVRTLTPSCSKNSTDNSICSSSIIRDCISQSTGQRCSTPTCSPRCEHGSTCFNTDMCACTSGWTGLSCATAICSPVCSNGGTCSRPGNCICVPGWTGSDCRTPLCPAGCFNGGTCTAPGACTCLPGFGSPDCSEMLCYHGKDKVDLIDGGQRLIEDLKMGDRVWSISPDGSAYIEDEIILMMHSEPNTTAFFYTINTIDGYHVSLTSRHVIPVYVSEENQIKLVQASEVTLKHMLIMFNRKVEIENITIDSRVGYFAPLTHTGYLLVNNISTSVYIHSKKISTKTVHRIAAPFRVYYRLMRWIFGQEYDPFETNVKEGLHPLVDFMIKSLDPVVNFMIKSNVKVIFIYTTPENILSALFIICILRFFPRPSLK